MAKTPPKEAIRASARRTARPKAAEAPTPAHPEPVEGPESVASNTVTTLPLFSLCLSGLNVRQTERDADIAALAEDIAARGLKQNLVVIPAHFSTAESPVAEPGTGDAEKQQTANYADRFEVVAGGRRYLALKLLAAAGRLPHDHPVPVMVEARDEARETSLSENLHRVAMNPADEFEAFAAIAAQQQHAGSTPAEAASTIARRFGVTQRHVEGRLRLASLAPEILDALRTAALTLDSAKAYAGTEDHQLQVKVFAAQAKSQGKPHDPATVRQALRGQTIALDDGRVKFIGLEAYLAAGGRTEVEMFMGTEGEERIVDGRLLDQLVKAAAELALPGLIEAGGWHDVLFAEGLGHAARMPKAPAGFTVNKSWGEAPTKAEKTQRIAVYAVSAAGTELVEVGHFKPAGDAAPAREIYTPMSAEERAQKLHDAWVDLWAARLAVGPFAGTPLEGKAFWPTGTWPAHMIKTEYAVGAEHDEAAEPIAALVNIQVRVTADQIEACREAAEAKVTELETEQAAREAAAAVDDEDEPDIDDDDVQTENDDEFAET